MSTIPYRVAHQSLFTFPDASRRGRVDFPWPIAEVLECEDVLVIRVDPVR